jgi:hypothetical protein
VPIRQKCPTRKCERFVSFEGSDAVGNKVSCADGHEGVVVRCPRPGICPTGSLVIRANSPVGAKGQHAVCFTPFTVAQMQPKPALV